jgi:hypothetical protein
MSPQNKEMFPVNTKVSPHNKEVFPANKRAFPHNKETFPTNKKMFPHNKEIFPTNKKARLLQPLTQMDRVTPDNQKAAAFATVDINSRQVDPTLFQSFECAAYTYTPKEQHGGKFQSYGKKCIMIGYTYGQ